MRSLPSMRSIKPRKRVKKMGLDLFFVAAALFILAVMVTNKTNEVGIQAQSTGTMPGRAAGVGMGCLGLLIALVVLVAVLALMGASV